MYHSIGEQYEPGHQEALESIRERLYDLMLRLNSIDVDSSLAAKTLYDDMCAVTGN